MEYLLLVYEFYKTKTFPKILWIIFIPLTIGLCIFLFSDKVIYDKNYQSVISSIVTVLGILVGFSISMFTILMTSSSENIKLAENFETNYVLHGKKLSLYRLLLINLGYIIIIEGVLLIFNIILPSFLAFDTCFGKAVFSFNVFLVIHVVFVTLRTILDFYFVITK